MYPDDPSIPTGRYHQSTCDYYCDKSTYYRELEHQPANPIIPQPAWTGGQWDKVQQLQSEVQGWRQKHAETLLAIDKLVKAKKKAYLYE